MALTKVTQHSLGNSAVTTAKLNLTTPLGIANSSANVLYMANSGNIGIGTSDPGSVVGGKALNIYNLSHSTVSIQSVDGGNDRNATLELLSSGNGGSYAQLLFGDTDTSPGTPSPLVVAGYHSGTRTERMRLSSNGNLGIGTANNTSRKLHVNGFNSMGTGSGVEDLLTLTNNNAVLNGVAGDRLGITISAHADVSDRRIGIYNTAQNVNFNNPDITFWQSGQGIAYRETMRLSAAGGYLGIGTTSPEGKLHVYSSNNAVITAHNPNYYGSSNFGKFQSLACATQFGAGESGTWKRVAYVSHSPILDVFGSVEQAGNPAFGGAKYRGAVRGTYGAVDMTEYLKYLNAMNGGGLTGLAYRYNNAGYVLEVYLTYSGSGPYGVSTVIQGLAQDAITV